MYQIEGTRQLFSFVRARRRARLPRVGRNVVLLGLTSMFTDVSSEMVATILPLYLVYELGLSPLAFGVVDGLQQGAGALVRFMGGFVGDRSRRHKETAAAGYALSAVTRLGLLAVGSVPGISAVVVADRVGKGIRTAPRDALISLSVPRETLATAFGVHRALDTLGAIIGPLLAFGILLVAADAFDAVFVVSFCFAAVGLAVLLFFVENRPGLPDRAAATLRGAAGLFLLPGFRRLVLVGSGLALATASDGFLYLSLQRRLDFEPTVIPLLYVGTAFAYTLLAVPLGRLGDRVGRVRVFLGGYGLLLLAYLSLLLPAGGRWPSVVGYLLLFGAYYAATEGVLMALASSVLPEELRGSGLALLVTATSVARLLASVAFGALWTWVGFDAAVAVFAVALAATLPAALLALSSWPLGRRA
jgi:MFS family permease